MVISGLPFDLLEQEEQALTLNPLTISYLTLFYISQFMILRS